MKVLITGGAGFIGCNAARRHLGRGDEVVILDNFSRPGAESNLVWLTGFGRPEVARVDLRDREEVEETVGRHRDSGLILHLAGQVAVTTSIEDPRSDFETNALGTFNLLEAVRRYGVDAPVIYSSTNKVYGGMDGTSVVELEDRYAYAELEKGVKEEQPLDFHSPYGCSKGAADQYVRDYHRIYGLKTVVLRQSCIYGYRQFGVEDQGWLAWFTIAALSGRPITLYGDGKQVRDVLFIDDLLDAFDAAAARIDRSAGRVYNIGGGPENTISLLDSLSFLRRHGLPKLAWDHAPWRPGDQRVFVSDVGLARRELGWEPRIGWRDGLEHLLTWVSQNLELFR